MPTKIINIKTEYGHCDSFVAYPDDEKPHPAVLFLMDAYGPRDYLYQMAKTIAARGYYVLLPNLFYRIKKAPVIDLKFPLKPEDMAEARSQLMSLIKQFSYQSAIADGKFFLDFLANQKEVATEKFKGKFLATGYCLGGSIAIRLAANYPDQFQAIASFHAGNLATTNDDSPHLLFNQIQAKIYIANADHDQSMPAEQIERLSNALADSGLKYEIETYQDAAHGFTMKDLPAFNEDASKRHWQKLFELFSG